MTVVDASVWVSSLIDDDVHHEESELWLTRWLRTRQAVVAPVIVLAEVAGAVARRVDDSAVGNQLVDDLSELSGLQLVELDSALATEAARIAASLRLRGADAVYVAVARQFGVPLVTWDQEELTRAASLIAVRTPLDSA